MESSGRKIVQILTDGRLGGAQRSVEWLAASVDRSRFDYRFVFLYSAGPVHDAILSMGYPVEVLWWKHGYELAGRWRLVRLLRRLDPDLIHDHSATPLTRIFMRMATRCPIVSTEHGDFAYGRSGALRRVCGRLDDRITEWVIANSAFSASAHSRLYKRPLARMRTVYLGLDLERYSLDGVDNGTPPISNTREDLFSSGGRVLRIAFVGRLELVKGILELPRLALSLCNRGVSNFEIIVAGEGSGHQPLLETAKQMGVQRHINCVGWQTDVRNVLRRSDVFVFPSLWDEPFGLAPLEALAAGLPVVAYDVGGVSEALSGAPGACLVPRGDIESMAEAVVTAVAGTGRRGANLGLEYVRRRFDMRRMSHELEDLYAEVTGVSPS